MRIKISLCLLCFLFAFNAYSEDTIILKTIKIKGNKELPKILYVVPWQEADKTKQKSQKLKLHDFFGDLYQPLSAEAPKTELGKNRE